MKINLAITVATLTTLLVVGNIQAQLGGTVTEIKYASCHEIESVMADGQHGLTRLKCKGVASNGDGNTFPALIDLKGSIVDGALDCIQMLSNHANAQISNPNLNPAAKVVIKYSRQTIPGGPIASGSQCGVEDGTWQCFTLVGEQQARFLSCTVITGYQPFS